MRYVRLVAAAVACLMITYFGVLAVAAARSGLSWREMDFDRDGTTSVWEFLAAADVGTRAVRRGAQTCTEYFDLEGGLPIKVRCPAG